MGDAQECTLGIRLAIAPHDTTIWVVRLCGKRILSYRVMTCLQFQSEWGRWLPSRGEVVELPMKSKERSE